MFSKKHDIFNVSVTFLALEVNLPPEKKNVKESALLSLVFKRGQHQRNETALINAYPLNDDEMAQNKNMYN